MYGAVVVSYGCYMSCLSSVVAPSLFKVGISVLKGQLLRNEEILDEEPEAGNLRNLNSLNRMSMEKFQHRTSVLDMARAGRNSASQFSSLLSAV